MSELSQIKVRMCNYTLTSAQWRDTNPTLQKGEIGYESDTQLMKIGDDVHSWNDLKYVTVADGAVTNAKIAANSITNGKLVNGTLDDEKIKRGTITGGTEGSIRQGTITNYNIREGANINGSKIATGTITGGYDSSTEKAAGQIELRTIVAQNLAPNAVTTSKIVDKAVTTAKINDGAVTTAKINDGAVTNEKIASYTITGGDKGNIKTDTITNQNIYSGANIEGSKLKDGTIKASKIEDSAITNAKIADGAVTTGKIQDGAITSEKIEDGTITNVKIENGAVTTSKIKDEAVTNSKISEVNVGKIVDGLNIIDFDFSDSEAWETGYILNDGTLSNSGSSSHDKFCRTKNFIKRLNINENGTKISVSYRNKSSGNRGSSYIRNNQIICYDINKEYLRSTTNSEPNIWTLRNGTVYIKIVFGIDALTKCDNLMVSNPSDNNPQYNIYYLPYSRNNERIENKTKQSIVDNDQILQNIISRIKQMCKIKWKPKSGSYFYGQQSAAINNPQTINISGISTSRVQDFGLICEYACNNNDDNGNSLIGAFKKYIVNSNVYYGTVRKAQDAQKEYYTQNQVRYTFSDSNDGQYLFGQPLKLTVEYQPDKNYRFTICEYAINNGYIGKEAIYEIKEGNIIKGQYVGTVNSASSRIDYKSGDLAYCFREGNASFDTEGNYIGLPYSSLKGNDNFIGINVLLETFMTALNNPKSKLYTQQFFENINNTTGKQYNNIISTYKYNYNEKKFQPLNNGRHNIHYNCNSYYGVVCSVLIQHAYNMNEYETTYSWEKSENPFIKIYDSGLKYYDEDANAWNDFGPIKNLGGFNAWSNERKHSELVNYFTKKSYVSKLNILRRGDIIMHITPTSGGGHATLVEDIVYQENGEIQSITLSQVGYPCASSRLFGPESLDPTNTLAQAATVCFKPLGDTGNARSIKRIYRWNGNTNIPYESWLPFYTVNTNEEGLESYLYNDTFGIDKGNKSHYRKGQGNVEFSQSTNDIENIVISNLINNKIKLYLFKKKSNNSENNKQNKYINTNTIIEIDGDKNYTLLVSGLEAGYEYLLSTTNIQSDFSTSNSQEFYVYDVGNIYINQGTESLTAQEQSGQTIQVDCGIGNREDGSYITGTLSGWCRGLTPSHVSLNSECGVIKRTAKINMFEDGTAKFAIKLNDEFDIDGRWNSFNLNGDWVEDTSSGYQPDSLYGGSMVLKVHYNHEFGQCVSLPVLIMEEDYIKRTFD